MSKVMFQIINADGQMVKRLIDWSTDESSELLETIERTIDVTSQDVTLFVIVDMYNVVKQWPDKNKKPSPVKEKEIIVQDKIWED